MLSIWETVFVSVIRVELAVGNLNQSLVECVVYINPELHREYKYRLVGKHIIYTGFCVVGRYRMQTKPDFYIIKCGL